MTKECLSPNIELTPRPKASTNGAGSEFRKVALRATKLESEFCSELFWFSRVYDCIVVQNNVQNAVPNEKSLSNFGRLTPNESGNRLERPLRLG